MPATVGEIFDALGGGNAVAKHFDLPASTIGSWKARGKIPAERWTAIVEMADAVGAEGITYESLAKVHAAKSPAPHSVGVSP